MIPPEFVPIANHLWQSTLFAGAAAFLTLALRRNSARVRYAVWLAASYKFLIPFSWLVSFGHLFEWRFAPPLVPQAIATVTNVVSTPVFLMPSATVAAAPQHSSLLPAAIWCIWACGFLILTAGWAREWWRIRRTAKRGTRLDFALPIPVVSVPSQLEPGVFGIFRPVLLFPNRIGERLAPEQLRAVVAHELCHVRRRDNLAAAIHMLVEALFWFHPLVWWLDRRIVDERERTCDEEVLRMGGAPVAYAETILAVCKSYVESPITCMSGISGSDLKRRVVNVMANRRTEDLGLTRKLLLSTLGIVAIALPVVFGVANAPSLHAQSATTDWEKAAGGKMEFAIASVRLNKGPGEPSNFPFGPDNAHTKTGGLFIGYYTLANYISFAYKILPTKEQFQSMFGKLPPWVEMDNYEIQARAAEPNPTPDQVRLMLQSLLKERFGLAVHYETQDTPVLVMSFAKRGKLGPKLRRHEDGPACTVTGRAPEAAPMDQKDTDIFPAGCGGVEAVPTTKGTILIGGRNVTLEMMATFFEAGHLGRPIVVGTGLSGNYDFTLNWMPEPGAFGRPPVTASQDDPLSAPQGPTFLEALKDQLGLKLKEGKVPLRALVIDRVERPSEN